MTLAFVVQLVCLVLVGRQSQREEVTLEAFHSTPSVSHTAGPAASGHRAVSAGKENSEA